MGCLYHHGTSRILGLGAAPTLAFAEPGVEPHYGPSWTFRVLHAHVHLHLDPDEATYEGESTFELAPLPTFDGTVRLDLDGVPVQAVHDVDGAPLEFACDDEHLVVHGVSLPGRITVRYGGHRPRAGLYHTGPTEAVPDRQPMSWTQCQDEDAHFFMPCLDHPRIKHPWTITLTGPADCILLSNGAEGERTEAGGWATAVWHQRDPMPAYLFTAVVGRFDVVDDTWRDRPVRYLVPPGGTEAARRAMGRTPAMMEHFSEVTGVAYPWPRYDQVVVHDFIFGGMENTACTTMTDLLLVDERVGPHWDPEGLVCHELAHQWFGDLVTCQDWSQAWLNEAFATFFETVWQQEAHGTTEATWLAHQQLRSYLTEDGGRYRRPIASYLFREPIDLFDRHLYEKGALVLRTLRTILGEEGFRAGVRAYLEAHAHGTVHGRDLQRAMEEATGTNLDRFVHQFILGAGHPELTVTLAQSEGLLTVTIVQGQTGDEVPEAHAVPLALEVVTASGTTSITLPVRERQRTWAVPVSGTVRTVRVDPGLGILATITLEAPVAWLTELSQDACPVLATRAVKALVTKNTPVAIRAVVVALHEHPFWGVRCEAAEQLGARGGAEARSALLDALEREGEPRVLAAVAKALGRFREKGVATALITAIDGGADTWHTLAALLEALGKTRDDRAVQVLKAHLSLGSWGEVVRRGALAGLAATEDDDVLDALLDAAADGRSPRVQAGAATALGTLGDRVESARKPSRERLEELAREGAFRVRLAALAALGTLGDREALPTLRQVHRSDPDGRVRRSAYEALARVERGRTSEDGLAALRERLATLEAQHSKLRTRLERLEPADQGA